MGLSLAERMAFGRRTIADETSGGATMLPLPGGEGRGEGERVTRTVCVS